ncbi:MAG: hypothetical protein FJW39_17475 [Acidobacteria bacterium]|nr:hypothetical protein [Acidobacteriota bacterium]
MNWRGVISLWACTCSAQSIAMAPAEPIRLPGISDSNSPAHWRDGRIYIYQSDGLPIMTFGDSQFEFLKTRGVLLSTYERTPLWIESTWADDDGTLYAWYHHEQTVCANLSAPRIGALVSYDGGTSFFDHGIVLESGDAVDCSAGNGYFAGGHGDFTVLLDHERKYFYFYFSNYAGPLGSQGVAAARMEFARRDNPRDAVFKFHDGQWEEPGLGGRTTAVMPATRSWAGTDAESYWGPALHWNYHLNQFVMLLNRVCCEPGWMPTGIWISLNPDLSNPAGWSEPRQILPAELSGWYPQVIGLGPGDTDKQAGRVARFYMGSDSYWEIIFNY